jgi:hypothetical protein
MSHREEQTNFGEKFHINDGEGWQRIRRKELESKNSYLRTNRIQELATANF